MKENSYLKKIIVVSVLLASICILAILGVNGIKSSFPSSGSNSSKICYEKTETEKQTVTKPQPVLKKFLLKPGCEPYVVKTNNRPIKWDGYRAGTEGQEVVLIRFKLISGELTPWMNIIDRDFKISELPDNRSTTEVHFGVPPVGSSQGMEVTLL